MIASADDGTAATHEDGLDVKHTVINGERP